MVVRTAASNDPIIPADADISALHDTACTLARTAGDSATLVLSDGTTVELPAAIVAAVHQVADVMSKNLAVAITPVAKRLTPQQAARMLNVRDQYFEGLLENGDIPFRATGTIRLIALEDLLAYKRVRDAQTRQALDELTRLSEEMGLYDIEL